MRPALVFPFNDPDGRMFRHLQSILPDLKQYFEHAYLCPPLSTLKWVEHIRQLQADDFFTIFPVDREMRVGEHFAYLYQRAADEAHPDQIIHLCFLDRLAFALEGKNRNSFLADIDSLAMSDVPLIFQRSQTAWETHPQNYRKIEGTVTTVGRSLFGRELDYAWCHIAVRAGQLRELMPRVKNPDLSMVAEMIFCLQDDIHTRDVDWLAWEDPFILSRDATELKQERENSFEETHKRLSYVLPMIETLTRLSTNGRRRYMPGIAVNVAVIHEGKILLTKREDFEVWCLPSGGVEEGESLAEAAIRETKEETGVDVELTRLVGVYSRLGGMPDAHAVLYEAKPIGGELRLQPGETIEVKYFAFDELPNEIAFAHKKRIADAINGSSGMSVKQEIKTIGAVVTDRNKLYALRDQSGLSRQKFYLERIEGSETSETVQLESGPYNESSTKWLDLARELYSISQSGLTYCKNEYDLYSYKRLQEISAGIIASCSDLSRETIIQAFSMQAGYATPKIDVRGAVFRQGRILLVQEKADGKWAMPGGWADIGDLPSAMVEREVFEEAGFEVKAAKVVAVYDANRIEPLEFFHAYKIIFLCDLLGGSPRPNHETLAVDFFELDNLPPLSKGRTSESMLREIFAHIQDPNRVTAFD